MNCELHPNIKYMKPLDFDSQVIVVNTGDVFLQLPDLEKDPTPLEGSVY